MSGGGFWGHETEEKDTTASAASAGESAENAVHAASRAARANPYAVGGLLGDREKPEFTFGFLCIISVANRFAEQIALETDDMTGSNDAWSLLTVNADDVAGRLALPRIQKQQLQKAISALEGARDAGHTLGEVVRAMLETRRSANPHLEPD
jgi:hypothetical protein